MITVQKFLILSILYASLYADVSKKEYDLGSVEAFIRKGKTNEALSIIEHILSESPSDLNAKVYLARCFSSLGRKDESEDILKSVLSENVNYVNALLALGVLYVQKQKWPDAESYLQQVLTLDTGNHIAIANLAKIWLTRDNDVTKSKEYLLKAHALNPTDDRVMFELGMVLFLEGEHLQAKRAFDEAQATNPDLDLKLIGRVYLHYGHVDWATVALRKYVKKRSEGGSEMGPDTQAELVLGECLEAVGASGAAQRIYEGVLSREPSNALAHSKLGLLLLGSGTRNFGALHACGLNERTALAHLAAAASLDPTEKAAADAIAFCREELGKVRYWRDIVTARGLDGTGTAGSATVTATTPTQTTEQTRDRSPWLGRGWEGGKRGDDAVRRDGGVDSYMTRTASTELRTRIQRALATAKRMLCWAAARVPARIAFLWLGEAVLARACGDYGLGLGLGSGSDSEARLASAISSRLQAWSVRSTMARVPQLSSPPTHATFMSEYVLSSRPLVIHGGLSSWGFGEGVGEGAGIEAAAFATEALLRQFGTSTVHVSVSQSGRFDGPEPGSSWGLDDDQDVLVRPPSTSMLFADFLSLAALRTNATAASSRASREPLQETFYIEAFTDLVPIPNFVVTKAVVDDEDGEGEGRPTSRGGVDLSDSVAEESSVEMDLLLSNVWIGTKPTVSPLHYDDYENLLCQIRGTKELILFPPEDIVNLYYEARPKGPLKYEYPGRFERDRAGLDRRAVVFGSSVNVDSPDLRKHPKYANAKPIRVVLKPGDMLYLPAYWHHEVQSIPDDGDEVYRGLNVAVNFWFANMTAPIDERLIFGVGA